VNERGSLAILVAGYLALLLTLFIGSTALTISLIAQNRVQGVGDAAVLYAHDRAVTKGIPDLSKLSSSVANFLNLAPSAQQLVIRSVEVRVEGVTSVLTLCVEHSDPVGLIVLGGICKTSKAESFLVD